MTYTYEFSNRTKMDKNYIIKEDSIEIHPQFIINKIAALEAELAAQDERNTVLINTLMAVRFWMEAQRPGRPNWNDLKEIIEDGLAPAAGGE